MFDAIVLSAGHPEPAARTLAGLVEGVVEGLLARVLLVSRRTDPELGALADASGCRIEQGVAAGDIAGVLARHLTTRHVLAFKAGALLAPGWPALLDQDFRTFGPPDPSATVAFRPAPIGARVMMLAGARIGGRLPIDYGLLSPRDRLLDASFDGETVKPEGSVRLARLTVGRLG